MAPQPRSDAGIARPSRASPPRPRRRNFSLTRLLREFRRPLLFGLVLVVIDGLMTLAGPIMVRIGIDNGVSTGSSTVLFAAAGVARMGAFGRMAMVAAHLIWGNQH